jgi:DtxR family transcriptional regulator, Mn-dependent transcriptional regulator
MMMTITRDSLQTASMEDYLEAILRLDEEGKPVTVTEISKLLNVKKPSVTAALTRLSEAGMVLHERYGDIALTRKGAGVAREVYRRHKTLRYLLAEILGVEPETAEEDACRMEHCMSAASSERLAEFIEFVLECPEGKPDFIKNFNYYLQHGERDEKLVQKCRKVK